MTLIVNKYLHRHRMSIFSVNRNTWGFIYMQMCWSWKNRCSPKLCISSVEHVKHFWGETFPWLCLISWGKSEECAWGWKLGFLFSQKEFYQTCPAICVVIGFKIQTNSKHISSKERRSSRNSLVKDIQRGVLKSQTIQYRVRWIQRWRYEMQYIKYLHETFWCSSD